MHFDMTLLYRRIAVGLIAATTAFAGYVSADTVGSEAAVKAAIVYKIAKFVTWPDSAFDSPDEPMSICLPADDPLNQAMAGLAGDSIHGRRIEIRPIDRLSIGSTDCEVLFLSGASDDDSDDLLQEVGRQPVLTVGDAKDFAKRGGIVSLQVRNNRVRFAINVEAGASAGLGISAQLLQIASRVDGGSKTP